MTTKSILALIDGEIEKLERARSLLSRSTDAKKSKAGMAGPKKKRTLSKEARERIAEAQRKRWAKFKKAAK